MILQRILKWLIVVFLFINFEFCVCLESTRANSQGKNVRQFQRDKRFVLPSGSGQFKLNNTFQSCITYDKKNGHCKHVTSCFLEELEEDMSRLPEFMCTIEDEFVGVCCPDDSLISSNSVTIQDTVAGVLPAISHLNAKGKVNDDALRAADTQTNKTRDSRGPRGCGVNAKIRSRVIGGRPAEPKEWPWMAALLRERNREQFCGGVLITNRHILTAAHCLFKERPRDVIVRLGEYDFTRSDDTRHVDISVQEIRMHQEFDYSTYENDIAILKMTRSTVFNSYIWPICLPPVDSTFENVDAYVTGWGTQYYMGPSSTVLMEVMIPVWPQSKCVENFTQRIPNSVLCASGYKGGKDACQGDSGGPLVYQLPNGRWVNIGIVSWGIKCGEPGRTGVYTRVNSFLNWIISNTQF